MKEKIAGIQVVRGILFILILCFHCGAPYAALGWGGVECFFVISSFFLTRKILLTDNLCISTHILHRIKRLYPPYIIILIPALLYSFVILRKIPVDLPIFLLSLQNFMWINTNYVSPMQPITAHTWTITIEIWLGTLWLILLLSNRSRVKKICYIAIFSAIMIRTLGIWLNCGPIFITLFPLAHADSFGIGGLLAVKSLEENKPGGGYFAAAMGSIGLLGIIASMLKIANNNGINIMSAYYLFSSSSNYLNNVISGNIYLFLSMLSFTILSVIIFNKNQIGLFFKPLASLGNISYEMYLFHWPILYVCANSIFKGKNLTWYISAIIYFCSTLVAVLIYNMFKNLFIRKS